jgi:membrane-associated protein
LSDRLVLACIIVALILLAAFAVALLFFEDSAAVQFVFKAADVVIHVDVYLGALIQQYGLLVYGIVFLIIFCETGLVFILFLPGDSLLFAVGGFAALGVLNVWVLILLFWLAAALGDSFNYFIGNRIGEQVYRRDYRFIKREYIDQTHMFFEKYGGKAIVLARFAPILRTFTPFVAGMGKMNYPRFLFYNVTGGLLWVATCVLCGYFFGNLPFVKENFSVFILGIIIVSLIPSVVEFFKHWQANRRKRQN